MRSTSLAACNEPRPLQHPKKTRRGTIFWMLKATSGATSAKHEIPGVRAHPPVAQKPPLRMPPLPWRRGSPAVSANEPTPGLR